MPWEDGSKAFDCSAQWEETRWAKLETFPEVDSASVLREGAIMVCKVGIAAGLGEDMPFV